jgi:hypothetical protein
MLVLLIFFLYTFTSYKNSGDEKFTFSETITKLVENRVIYKNKNEIIYPIYTFYGIIASLLSVIGAWACIKSKKNLILIFWSIISLTMISINYLFNITILIRAERLMFFTILGLIPLSAIGLSCLVSLSQKRIKKKYLIISLTIWLGLMFIILFYHYVEKPTIPKTVHYINNKEYDALLWIKDKYGTENIIITPLGLNYAVYPSTKNYAFCHRFEDCIKMGVKDFYNNITDCNKNLYFLKTFNLKTYFIIHNNEINCSHLKLIYNNSQVLIYKAEQENQSNRYVLYH